MVLIVEVWCIHLIEDVITVGHLNWPLLKVVKPIGQQLFGTMGSQLTVYSWKWCWTVLKSCEEDYNINMENSPHGYFPHVTGNKASFAICMVFVPIFVMVVNVTLSTLHVNYNGQIRYLLRYHTMI